MTTYAGIPYTLLNTDYQHWFYQYNNLQLPVFRRGKQHSQADCTQLYHFYCRMSTQVPWQHPGKEYPDYLSDITLLHFFFQKQVQSTSRSNKTHLNETMDIYLVYLQKPTRPTTVRNQQRRKHQRTRLLPCIQTFYAYCSSHSNKIVLCILKNHSVPTKVPYSKIRIHLKQVISLPSNE